MSDYVTPNQFDSKYGFKVVRPTMHPDREEAQSNKGTLVHMLEGPGDPGDPPPPEREPLKVEVAARWASSGNVYEYGQAVYASVAQYSGGVPETTTYRWRLQTRASADDQASNGSWTNYTDQASEVPITIETWEGQIRFQCQARDTGVDPVEQVNSFASWQNITEFAPLAATDPVATGEPFVGYTLSCSEPVVTGGSGQYQIDYYWVDVETSAIIWENNYMGNTTKVVEYDLGKSMYCMCVCTDQVTKKSVTVESNRLGPINRPILPEFDTWVEGQLYDDPNEQIGVVPNGSVVIEVRQEPSSAAAADITYSWAIRTGTGRLSGDETSTGIIYLAPEAAPAGALVVCTATSRDASDQATAAEVTVLTSEESLAGK